MSGIQRRLVLVAYMLGGFSALTAQVEFHGHVYPLARLNFESRYLNLPHRVVSLEGQNRGRNVNLFLNTTLEYRLAMNSAAVELQEAYAEFSTGLGDFRFGQQVIAWGAADGNNPTDNVNPYDFYYLFIPGSDRKASNVMASVNLYLGSVNLEVVATPVFQSNRLPFGEEDFPVFEELPFDLDTIPEVRPDRDLENTEFGFRARMPLSMMDVSLSYFKGFERMFTAVTNTFPGGISGLEYNPVQVLGGDLVTFISDWAIRAEGAYFLTEDTNGNLPHLRNPYLQYVLQLDYTGQEYSIMLQYLGGYITKVDDDTVTIPLPPGSPIPFVQYTEAEYEGDHIPAKIGMPFAAIAQNAVLATASYDFADGRYSVKGQGLYDLDKNGYMIGGKLTLALEEAFDLELGISYMDGEEGSRLRTIGEVFSHVYVGMKYSF
ncbi:MAG: hypothetical protein JSU77_02105 [Fidelibacterota bacterium]|nr:MAG: hypothetical protein JSU77_02105 [Candidatus Neomarinimicrobiota bacterium]